MDIKNILIGAVAATVVGSVSAATSVSTLEKQDKAQTMKSIIGELTAVVSHPECTIKGSKTKK